MADYNNKKFPPPPTPEMAFRAMQIDKSFPKLRRQYHFAEKLKGREVVEKPKNICSSWPIDDENVPSLPFRYLLRRTHTIISGLKASLIASNIVRSLQKLSIIAQFDNLKMIAHAQTSNHTKFNIRLFSTRNNTDSPTDCKNIIVELNCVSSREFGFHQLVNAILEEARGNTYEIADEDGPRNRLKVNRDLFPQLLSPQSQKEHAKSALIRAERLLGNDRYDANSLGMESLLLLTDKQVCGNIVSTLAAKSVLAKDECDFINLDSRLYDFFVRGRYNFNGHKRRNNDNFFKDHYHKMKCDLLLILIHSIELLSSSPSDLSFDERCSDIWLSKDFIHALLEDMLQAIDAPHGAHIAFSSMQCLHCLVLNSMKVRTTILSMKYDLEPTLRKIYNVGINHHNHLAKESKYFMSTLEAM